MRVVRDTPFEFGQAVWQIHPPQVSLTLVIKGTFSLIPGTEVCPIAEAQTPCHGGQNFDDDPTQSPRLDSDLAVWKPRGECFLAGTCFAPQGRPAPATVAGLSLGTVQKQLLVVGDRSWGLLGAQSAPEPFVSMPLRWERSFGGASFEANPFGRGIEPQETATGKRRLLPNLEDPARPVRSASDRPAPAGFGPMHQTLPERRRLMGTYDRQWLKTRWPWYPEDFDWEFYNAAPRDQRIVGYWRGDETLTLLNLHPTEPTQRYRLPGLQPRIWVEVLRNGAWQFEEVPARLDTISVDADAGKLHCLWRGLVTVASERLTELRTLFYFHEPCLESSTPDQCYARYQKKLREEQEEDEALELVPPEAPGPDELDATTANTDDPLGSTLSKLLSPAFAQGGLSFASLVAKGSGAASGPEAPELKSQLEAQGEEVPPELDEAARAVTAQRADTHEDTVSPEVAPAITAEEVLARKARGESFEAVDFSDAVLSGLELSGCDFTAAVLSRVDFSGAKLSHCKFDGAVLSGCQFTDADLQEASFLEADLTEVSAKNCNARGVQLQGASAAKSTWSGTQFTGASFEKADFSESVCEQCVFVQADLSVSDWTAARVSGSDFTESVLVDTSMEKVVAQGCNFQRAKLKKFRASEGADFRGANFERVEAPEATFAQSNLNQANFSLAILTRADFSEGHLVATVFHGADLRNTRFDLAEMTGVVMLKANAFEANFEGATLLHADLRGSNFFGAQFWRAKLDYAQLDTALLDRTHLEGQNSDV